MLLVKGFCSAYSSRRPWLLSMGPLNFNRFRIIFKLQLFLLWGIVNKLYNFRFFCCQWRLHWSLIIKWPLFWKVENDLIVFTFSWLIIFVAIVEDLVEGLFFYIHFLMIVLKHVLPIIFNIFNTNYGGVSRGFLYLESKVKIRISYTLAYFLLGIRSI